jgi:hypothetical protein
MGKTKKAFLFYYTYEEYFVLLDDTKKAQLLMSLFRYVKTGRKEKLDGMVEAFYVVITNDIDRDTGKWNESAIRRQNAAKMAANARWHTRDTFYANDAYDAVNVNGIDTDKVNVNEKVIKNACPPSFEKPTLDQVKEYCISQKLPVNPLQWYDHYVSNGWMIGNNTPMQDWKASIRNWERNSFSRHDSKCISVDKDYKVDKYIEMMSLQQKTEVGTDDGQK